MPTYQYECECGSVTEEFRRAPGARTRICPDCGRVVRKVCGPGAGVIFKGHGFYETDYKRKERKR